MTILVLSIGAITIIGGLIAGAIQLLEYARRKTERSIAIFYRDQPLECTMMLNRISLAETKKEISNIKHKEKHGF
jgi:hypothetical protein